MGDLPLPGCISRSLLFGQGTDSTPRRERANVKITSDARTRWSSEIREDPGTLGRAAHEGHDARPRDTSSGTAARHGAWRDAKNKEKHIRRRRKMREKLHNPIHRAVQWTTYLPRGPRTRAAGGSLLSIIGDVDTLYIHRGAVGAGYACSTLRKMWFRPVPEWGGRQWKRQGSLVVRRHFCLLSRERPKLRSIRLPLGSTFLLAYEKICS